jgi:hypothetical protein
MMNGFFFFDKSVVGGEKSYSGPPASANQPWKSVKLTKKTVLLLTVEGPYSCRLAYCTPLSALNQLSWFHCRVELARDLSFKLSQWQRSRRERGSQLRGFRMIWSSVMMPKPTTVQL